MLMPCNKSNTFQDLLHFKILFLKSTKVFEFRRVGSKLFHSMIVEVRKEFLKKLCIMILKQVMLSTFLVAYTWVFSGYYFKTILGTFAFVNFVKRS